MAEEYLDWWSGGPERAELGRQWQRQPGKTSTAYPSAGSLAPIRELPSVALAVFWCSWSSRGPRRVALRLGSTFIYAERNRRRGGVSLALPP